MSTPDPHEPPSDAADDTKLLDTTHDGAAPNDQPGLTRDGTPPDDESRDVVQSMVDMLAREQAEPRDGFEPVPFWVALVFGSLLAWGGFYMGTNSADFRADVFDRSDLRTPESGVGAANVPDPDPQTVEELMKIGAAKFGAICATCHQTSGEGKPGEGIPPLKESEWVVGNEASAARLSRIVLYGLSGPIQVGPKTYNGVMPNQGNVLKDYEIAGVLTYIRNNPEWGHAADKGKPPALTAAVVRGARIKEGNRKPNGSQPVSSLELLKLLPDYSDLAPVPAPKKAEPK